MAKRRDDERPPDSLTSLSPNELEQVRYTLCRTTLRGKLREGSTLVERLGVATEEARGARATIRACLPITNRQVEQWSSAHPKIVDGSNLNFNDGNVGKAFKGRAYPRDPELALTFAEHLLYFYLLGDSFRRPPLPDSTPEYRLATQIYTSVRDLIKTENGCVATPISLDEIKSERARRTFGLRHGMLKAARICVSSGRLPFLEGQPDKGLFKASQDFLDADGKLIFLCPQDSDALTADDMPRFIREASKKTGFKLLQLDPRDTRTASEEAIWAGEYLSRVWRYVLYETVDDNDRPEQVFFLQGWKGEPITRLAIDCVEAKEFAAWVDTFTSPVHPASAFVSTDPADSRSAPGGRTTRADTRVVTSPGHSRPTRS